MIIIIIIIIIMSETITSLLLMNQSILIKDIIIGAASYMTRKYFGNRFFSYIRPWVCCDQLFAYNSYI